MPKAAGSRSTAAPDFRRLLLTAPNPDLLSPDAREFLRLMPLEYAAIGKQSVLRGGTADYAAATKELAAVQKPYEAAAKALISRPVRSSMDLSEVAMVAFRYADKGPDGDLAEEDATAALILGALRMGGIQIREGDVAAADIRVDGPRLDCEDDFHTIADGLATLWLIWDSVANGSIGGRDVPERGLHFVIDRMDDAVKSLGPKLGLKSSEDEEEEAHG